MTAMHIKIPSQIGTKKLIQILIKQLKRHISLMSRWRPKQGQE